MNNLLHRHWLADLRAHCLGVALALGIPVVELGAASVSRPSAPEVSGLAGMVVAGEALGAEAGVEILRAGGNAIDAAVAAAFAVSVTDIGNSGLGGGGGMMIWLNGPKRAEFVEFYSRAGSARGTSGPARNAGIPGNAAGLLDAHERFGRLSRQEVLAPAVRLAGEGFAVPPGLSSSLGSARSKIRDNAPAEVFDLLFPGGTAMQAGEWLVQAEKAALLRMVAGGGRDAFYLGRVAERLVQELNAAGNPATVEDFAGFEPRWQRPVIGGFRQYAVLSAPPPLGGTQVVQPLVILDRFPLEEDGLPQFSGDVAARIIDAFRVARRDYYNRVFDPETPVPAAGIVSPDYALERLPLVGANPIPHNMPGGDPWPFDDSHDPRFAHLEPWGASPEPAAAPEVEPVVWISGEESHEPGEEQTTHVSVVDREGNAVAITMTLGPSFGDGFYAGGVFFNTAISRFGGPSGNQWAAGRTPRSNTSPTIVLEDDEVRLVTGARGGSRIPAAVVYNILYALEYGFSAGEAMAAGRAFPFRATPDLQIEMAFQAGVFRDLEDRGWEVETYSSENSYFAGAYTILAGPDGTLQGSHDRRRSLGGMTGHSGIPIPLVTAWAVAHGLSGDDTSPRASPADDGFTNTAKFAFGLSPTEPATALASVERGDNELVLRWNRSTSEAVSYRVERNSNLPGGAWDPVNDALPQVMDSPDTVPPEGFERVEWRAGHAGEERVFYRIVSTVDPDALP